MEPVILPTESGQVVKERLLHFVRSLSTVLAFAYCLSRYAYFLTLKRCLEIDKLPFNDVIGTGSDRAHIDFFLLIQLTLEEYNGYWYSRDQHSPDIRQDLDYYLDAPL